MIQLQQDPYTTLPRGVVDDLDLMIKLQQVGKRPFLWAVKPDERTEMTGRNVKTSVKSD